MKHPVLAAAIFTTLSVSSSLAKVDFEKEVLPLLEKSCRQCHQAPYEEDGRLKNPKAGLRFDAAWAIMAGSDDGKVLEPGSPQASPMLVRTTLPEDDDDFMPPKGEKWTEADQKVVSQWISEGADFGDWQGNLEGKPAEVVTQDDAPQISSSQLHYERLAAGLAPAAPQNISAVETVGGRAVPLAMNHPLLSVDFLAARESTTDETLAALRPIAENLAQLDLSRTAITGAGLQHLEGMPRLTRLDLHSTQAGDEGMKYLSSLENLTYLNLYNSQVTDAGLNHLAKLGQLRNLYLWQSKVTPAGVKKLQKALPDTVINWQ